MWALTALLYSHFRLVFYFVHLLVPGSLAGLETTPSGDAGRIRLKDFSDLLLNSPNAHGYLDFADAYGRQRIFRGTNVVVKGPPYLPFQTHFDRDISLVGRDYELMRKAGLNLIRLGVMWVGAEPTRGKYNESYFAAVSQMIDSAAGHNIFTLADMHQDCYAETVCGEGLPNWAAIVEHKELLERNNSVLSPLNVGDRETHVCPCRQVVAGCDMILIVMPDECSQMCVMILVHFQQVKSVMLSALFEDYLDKFPRPVYPAFTAFDPASGFPTRKDCAKLETKIGNCQASYAAEATGQAFENLYTNADGLTDLCSETRSWGKASLIGYELINEPFAGNIYTNPMLAIPRFADAWRLQPAYDKVAKSIREADPEGLIYFAGVTWADMHDHVEYSGFSHAPGGEEFKNRSVMAYHYYTPPQGENTSAGYYHNWVVPNAERLGTGQMLTEFDRATPEQDFANFENFGLSWAWWEWKSFCKETKNTKNSLSQYAAWGSCKTGYGGVFPADSDRPAISLFGKLVRMYPQALQGAFVRSFYNVSSFQLDLEFAVDPGIQAASLLHIGTVYDAGVYSAAELQRELPSAFANCFEVVRDRERRENHDVEDDGGRFFGRRSAGGSVETISSERQAVREVDVENESSKGGERRGETVVQSWKTEVLSSPRTGELVLSDVFEMPLDVEHEDELDTHNPEADLDHQVTPAGALTNEGIDGLILSLRATKDVARGTSVHVRVQRRFFVHEEEIDAAMLARRRNDALQRRALRDKIVEKAMEFFESSKRNEVEIEADGEVVEQLLAPGQEGGKKLVPAAASGGAGGTGQQEKEIFN
eukprot:g1500.t1